MPRRKPGTLFPIEVDILGVGLLLQASQDTFYGFALARGLAAASASGLTAHGTLYKALGRMTDAGLLDSHWEDASIAETEGRPRRRLYRVTPEGAAALETARAATLAEPSIRIANEGAPA